MNLCGGSTRRGFLGSAVALGLLRSSPAQEPESFGGSLVLGRPTGDSITLNVLAPKDLDAYLEYGVKPGAYTEKARVARIQSGKPLEMDLDQLKPNTRYYYRLRHRQLGEAGFVGGAEYSFHTQRMPGSTFTFGVQGDSHPERAKSMYSPDLYLRTMLNVRKDEPDFYVALGDDFSLDQLYNRGTMNQSTVDRLYAYQRRFLGLVGSSAPVFLVNGNHEQAARYLLDGTPDSAPVLAGRARNAYFPQPAPDGFYTGDAEPVEFVGLRRDYYAWTWGDALFVTIDPYWHSPVQIDEGLGGHQKNGDQGGARNREGWPATMGDAQYQWLKRTLELSKAKYKFVFAHHVLGTGRGGVEMADLFEWGGRSRSGAWEFDKQRPGWELPVHQLMAKNGVTIFFQGHDHLFARQQKDGMVYQETPNPADDTYTTFNRDAFRSGDILPNSGHLRVTVSPAEVKVDYVRSFLPKDATPDRKNGAVAYSYTVTAGRRQ
jgi:hypothetical protein